MLDHGRGFYYQITVCTPSRLLSLGVNLLSRERQEGIEIKELLLPVKEYCYLRTLLTASHRVKESQKLAVSE